MNDRHLRFSEWILINCLTNWLIEFILFSLLFLRICLEMWIQNILRKPSFHFYNIEYQVSWGWIPLIQQGTVQCLRHFNWPAILKVIFPIHNSTLQSKIDGHVFVLRKSNWIDADSDPNPYPDLGQEHFFKIYWITRRIFLLFSFFLLIFMFKLDETFRD